MYNLQSVKNGSNDRPEPVYLQDVLSLEVFRPKALLKPLFMQFEQNFVACLTYPTFFLFKSSKNSYNRLTIDLGVFAQWAIDFHSIYPVALFQIERAKVQSTN